jgi:putative nucleotidyltransferase with HDIG domain
MSENQSTRDERWTSRQKIFLIVLLILTSMLSLTAMLVPIYVQNDIPQIEVGDVAPRDILAQQSISFESEVLTEQQREAAANNVSPIYTVPDTSVARYQVERLRAALNFITIVRIDEHATQEQKMADLAAMEDIHLLQESIELMLALNNDAWQSVQQESIVVLEQVMRSTVREDRLEDSRRSVPALVSLSLAEDQANLVVELVRAFVSPNSLYSETLTEAAREEVREAIEPVTRTFVTNQTIVRRGQIISDAAFEALIELDLVKPKTSWQDYVSMVTLVVAVFTFISIYMQYHSDLIADLRALTVIALLFVVFLFGARFFIPERTVIPYLFPVAGFGLLVTALFNVQAGMVLSLPLCILTAYGLPNALALTIYYIMGSLFGILTLRRGQRIFIYFLSGAVVGGAGAAVILAYRLPEPTSDLIGIATLLGASFVNGLIAASLTIITQYFLAQLLGLTTTLQLQELSRPDHPLLQFILRNAPGTYQHSLLVANLAEQAAELIGANTLLTRVGALYHDTGKARFPHLFIENQVTGSHNPHDDLPPQESATSIIRHVSDGLELASKHRLSNRVKDFISEHHGSMTTRYQYIRAVKNAGGDETKVNDEAFQYPGPRPQSTETALLMLADACEATTRARRPETVEVISEIINDIFETRLIQGQLDDTDLTMRELNIIKNSFISTMRGVYHPRITYPKLEEPSQEEPTIKAGSRSQTDHDPSAH